MAVNFEQMLDRSRQSALADQVVTMTAAVASDASAPDFAARTLAQSRSETLTPDQRAAAAAMQAYGVRCAAAIFTAALDQSAAQRADALKTVLEHDSPDEELALLESDPGAGAEFKSRMSLAIAAKCADLVAAEIDRQKKGPITILNEEDRQLFEQQHTEHQKQRAEAVTAFLSSLPERYPPFGASLFAAIERDVRQQIEDKYKSPDIHAAVAAIFRQALEAMPSKIRKEVSRAG